MLERIKSLVLIVLVMTSLYLTYLFWMEMHITMPLMIPPAAKIEPGVDVPPFIDLLSPRAIIVHNGSRKHRLTSVEEAYSELWEALKSQSDLHDWDLQSASMSQWVAETKGAAYEFRFAGPIHMDLWWYLLGRGAAREDGSQAVYFDRILIPLRGSSIYFLNTRDQNVYRWDWQRETNEPHFPTIARLRLPRETRVTELESLANVNILPASILLPEGELLMREVYAALPIHEQNRKDIVNQFMQLTPWVRRTDVLRDGELVIESYITTRQQILRLHNHGMLEFVEPNMHLVEALDTIELHFVQAIYYLSGRGDWPGQMVIAGMEGRSSGDPDSYSFSFQQLYQGIPIIDFEPTFELVINSGGELIHRRKMYTLGREGFWELPLYAPQDALRAAQRVKPNSLIVELYIAYLQRPFTRGADNPFKPAGEYLYPVWVVEFADGEQVFLHGYTGRLITRPRTEGGE